MTAFIQLVVAVAATAQLFFQGETVQYEISVTNAEVVDPMMPFCGTATQDLMIPTVTLTLQTGTTMDNAPDYCTDQGGYATLWKETFILAYFLRVCFFFSGLCCRDWGCAVPAAMTDDLRFAGAYQGWIPAE